MIDPSSVPDVAADETLARYILRNKYVRADLSIKLNAFMPPVNLELSVTRHLLASEEELWSVGEDVAIATCTTLYGRGDIQASHCLREKLAVQAAPLPVNANHAHIVGWPAEKFAQKIIAQEIAAKATYVPKS